MIASIRCFLRLSPRFGQDRVARDTELVPRLLHKQMLALHFLGEKALGCAARQQRHAICRAYSNHHDRRARGVRLQAAIATASQKLDVLSDHSSVLKRQVAGKSRIRR